MQQSLPIGSTEFHGATSSTVKSLMEKNIIPVDTFVQTFLQTILVGTEHHDPQVVDAWLGCLLEVIPLLPFHVLQQDVTPIVLKKTLHERPLFQRIAGCKILGVLCRHYPIAALKRELLPTVLSLCQDVSAEVRSETAGQLPAVFQPLGSDVINQLLTPLLVDLASEDITRVKGATLRAIVSCLPLFTSGSIKATIIPLLKQLFDHALKYDSILLLDVAEHFGKVLEGIGKHDIQSDREYFTWCYICIVERATEKFKWLARSDPLLEQEKLCPETTVLLRKFCANNYAEVVEFMYSEDHRANIDLLHKILKSFVSDAFWEVRKIIAASMPRILMAYGKYKLLLKDEYLYLLNDDMECVLEDLVPHLASALVELAHLDAFVADQLDPLNSQLLRYLKHCEDLLSASLNWRLQSLFVEQMEVMWFIFPTDVVFKQFVDAYLQKILKVRVSPLRLAYIRSVLVNSKYSQNPAYRTEVKNKILELSRDKSFYNRLLYVQACYIIMDIYSTLYFKENFFLPTLQLSADRVANIRWGVCKMLPKLHNMLKFPGDEHLYKSLKACISKLETDSDREVRIMFDSVQKDLEFQDDQAYPCDQSKEDEEIMLSSLNPQVIQHFPSSVKKLFDPSNVSKIFNSLPEKNSFTVSELNSVSKTDSDLKTSTVFTNQEFLVDTGVSLNNVNNLNSTNAENSPINLDGVNNSKTNGNQASSQSGAKPALKKKQVLQKSIPIRKKSFLPEPSVAKTSIAVSSLSTQKPCINNNDQTLDNVKKRNHQETNPDKRRSRIARRPENRYSIDVMEFHRRNSVDSNLVGKLESLELADKKATDIKVEEFVDINKNVAGERPKEGDGKGAVQRKKKSQLPRPLSCIALPVKTVDLEKANAVSKLPMLRRS